MIGSDITKNAGWIKSGRRKLLHLPEGGWMYSFEAAFHADPTLTIA